MPEIAVYDLNGDLRTLEWAHEKYGPFIIYPAAPATPELTMAWRLTALREKNDSTYITRTLGEDGQPVPGVRNCFYWPDAPELQDAGPLGAPFEGITPGRAVEGYSNAGGDTGYGMGSGAHYDVAIGERGPHAAWIHGTQTRSDVLLGIGMIFADHLHLNATWTLTEDPSEEEEDDLAAMLRQLADDLRNLADLVEGYSNA